MKLRIPIFLKQAMNAVTGHAQDKEPQAPTMVSVDRNDLTISVIDEFSTKKRTGDALASMWDHVADLTEEGLSQYDGITDRQEAYLDTLRDIAAHIRETSSFSDTVELPQSHIDTITQNKDIIYRAKEGTKDIMQHLPSGVRGETYIAEDEFGEDGVFYEPSEFENAITNRHNALATFAFKLDGTLGKYASTDVDGPQPDL